MASNTNSCDCTKIPFKKECLKYCTELILRKATPEEKISILGMDAQLAYAIRYAYVNRNINSFEDLEKALTSSQINQLLLIFGSLNQSQIDYFNKK